VKVEVLSSDLIIYAAGCRGLPLRFTALRKQEQIERSRWNEADARRPNEAESLLRETALSARYRVIRLCIGKRMIAPLDRIISHFDRMIDAI